MENISDQGQNILLREYCRGNDPDHRRRKTWSERGHEILWSGIPYGTMVYPHQGYLDSRTAQDYSASDVRFFAISENCFVVTSVFGIWLYHIPEFRSVGEDTMLVPVWNLLVDASDYRGTLYKTASPYPALWLQGEQNSCTLEFDVDESGCYPVVANYKFVVSPPDFYMGTIFKLQGRKGMSIEAGLRGEIAFNTEVLGKTDTRRLRAQIPGLNDEPRITRDEVKYVDLDEETGRIMVVVGPVQGNIPYARQLYIADLPP